DDVRRRLRPELRELDPALLERRTVAARDQRVADLPLDLVERVPAGDREEAADAEASGLVDDRVDHLLDRRLHALPLLDACHTGPSRTVATRVFPTWGFRWALDLPAGDRRLDLAPDGAEPRLDAASGAVPERAPGSPGGPG